MGRLATLEDRVGSAGGCGCGGNCNGSCGGGSGYAGRGYRDNAYAGASQVGPPINFTVITGGTVAPNLSRTGGNFGLTATRTDTSGAPAGGLVPASTGNGGSRYGGATYPVESPAPISTDFGPVAAEPAGTPIVNPPAHRYAEFY